MSGNMRRWAAGWAGAVSIALGAAGAEGANVLVLSSGSPVIDGAVQARLQGLGHVVTLGPEYQMYTGGGLAGQQVVYLQANFNWSAGDMPATGQQALLSFINAGGGLVTCEWVVWKLAASAQFLTLGAAFAAEPTAGYTGATSVTFTGGTADPIIDAGLPASFTTPVDNYGGTHTLFNARTGATTFFTLDANAGLVGGTYGAGRVAQFSTTNGPSQVNDPNFGRLLSNTVTWAAQGAGPCRADMNGDGAVNVQDFLTFLQLFAGADARADFDRNGQVNLQDFLGYLQAYAAGC